MLKRYKKLLLAAVCLLLISVGATAAYFTHWKKLQNQFTIGENTIEITEEFDPPKELTVGDNIYKKKVQIENTGTVPCFVRVFAEFSDSSIRKFSELSPDGSTYYPADEYTSHLPKGWVYISEDEDEILGGYYYWTGKVAVNASTDPLFEKVKTHFDNADQIKDYDIIVYAESVQVNDKNGAEFTGNDAYKAAWTEFLQRK